MHFSVTTVCTFRSLHYARFRQYLRNFLLRNLLRKTASKICFEKLLRQACKEKYDLLPDSENFKGDRMRLPEENQILRSGRIRVCHRMQMYSAVSTHSRFGHYEIPFRSLRNPFSVTTNPLFGHYECPFRSLRIPFSVTTNALFGQYYYGFLLVTADV